MRRLLIVIAFVAALAIGRGWANTPVWEEVAPPAPATTQTIDMDADTQIAVANGYIYLWTEKPVTVKLFSILGQLISQETIKPGLHRIKLSARGIYIVRAGTATRRVTL